MKWVSAVLNTNVEQGQGEQGNVRVSVVDKLDNRDRCLARRTAFLGVDQVCDFEVEGEIRLEVGGGIACVILKWSDLRHQTPRVKLTDVSL